MMNPFITAISLQNHLLDLPQEVICRIFQASLTESRFKESQPDEYGVVTRKGPMTTPFTLGAVCSVWRTIAFDDPELWSSVYLVAIPYRAARQALLLRDWLDRSGDLHLTIEIDCSSDDRKSWHAEHHVEASQLLAPVLRHNSHCTTFRTRLPPDCLLLPPRGSQIPDPKFSNLTTLSVVPREIPFEEDDEEPCYIDLFQHASRLRRVEISELAFEQLTMSWSKVVKVTTTVVSLKDCIEILRAAPEIEECVFNNIIHFGDDCNLASIVSRRLSALTLDFREVDVRHDHITRILTAPNLRKLEYLHIHGDAFPATDFVDFMQRSHCHLADLCIRNSFMSRRALRRVLLSAQVAPSVGVLDICLSSDPDTQDQLATLNPSLSLLSRFFPRIQKDYFFSGPLTTLDWILEPPSPISN